MFESDADSGALNGAPAEQLHQPRGDDLLHRGDAGRDDHPALDMARRYFPVPVTFCSGVMMLLLPPGQKPVDRLHADVSRQPLLAGGRPV